MSRASIAPSESRRTMKCSAVVAIGVDRRGVGPDNGATGACHASCFGRSLPHSVAHLFGRPRLAPRPPEAPGVDALYPPGDASLPVGRQQASSLLRILPWRLPGYHQLERIAPRAVVSDVARYLPRVLWRHWHYASVLDLHRERPVPARGTAEGGLYRPSAAHPDGDAGALQRRRVEDGPPFLLEGIACDPVVFSTVAERFAAPQAREHLEPLVEHGPAHPRVRLLAQVVPLVGHRADADAQDQSSAGEVVQGGGLPRQLRRTAPGQRRDHRTQPYAARAKGDCGQRNPRVDYRHRSLGEGEEVVP